MRSSSAHTVICVKARAGNMASSSEKLLLYGHTLQLRTFLSNDFADCATITVGFHEIAINPLNCSWMLS